MKTSKNSRLKNPPHPGGFVKTEMIEPLKLSVTEAARALGVTRPALSALLNERASLSPEMALRIEKAFGVGMDTLMRMQNSYDIVQARQRESAIKVKRFPGKPEVEDQRGSCLRNLILVCKNGRLTSWPCGPFVPGVLPATA